jgi:molybdopterin synthase catalytic subunit
MTASLDAVELRDTSLDVGDVLSAFSDGGAGAIGIFLGVTRAEKNQAGQNLLALEYEAYRDMAVSQIQKLASEARIKWPIIRLVVLHRLGRVMVGQPSVLIAVSTPHRAESFEACRILIDQLKAEAAIWKKEIWEDGSSSWVAGNVPQKE